MPKALRLLPALTTALLGVSAQADTLSVNARADAFSEPVSIDAFLSGWHGQLHPGDDAALHARLELRADDGPWHVAWRWRYDYQLKFAPDTAELYHAVRNHLPVTTGRPYPLDVRAYHVERHGPALGYRLERSHWDFELSLNLYQGLELVDGQTQGHATFQSSRPDGDQLNDLLAHIDYRYSEPELHEEDLDWQPKRPNGWGYGFDIRTQGTLPTGTELRLQIEDMLGAIRWQQTPETAADLRCDCTLPDYDLTGGLNVRRHYRQRLKPLVELQANQPLAAQWQLGARFLHDGWLKARQLGLQHHHAGHLWGLWYEPEFHAWRLAYEQPYVRLSWTADSFDTSEAHRLGVNLTLFGRW